MHCVELILCSEAYPSRVHCVELTLCSEAYPSRVHCVELSLCSEAYPSLMHCVELTLCSEAYPSLVHCVELYLCSEAYPSLVLPTVHIVNETLRNKPTKIKTKKNNFFFYPIRTGEGGRKHPSPFFLPFTQKNFSWPLPEISWIFPTWIPYDFFAQQIFLHPLTALLGHRVQKLF